MTCNNVQQGPKCMLTAVEPMIEIEAKKQKKIISVTLAV